MKHVSAAPLMLPRSAAAIKIFKLSNIAPSTTAKQKYFPRIQIMLFKEYGIAEGILQFNNQILISQRDVYFKLILF